MTSHEPSWPDGQCATCAQPWPCEPRIDQLVTMHGTGLPLSSALWDELERAAQANPSVPFLLLYGQCIRRPIVYIRTRENR